MMMYISILIYLQKNGTGRKENMYWYSEGELVGEHLMKMSR